MSLGCPLYSAYHLVSGGPGEKKKMFTGRSGRENQRWQWCGFYGIFLGLAVLATLGVVSYMAHEGVSLSGTVSEIEAGANTLLVQEVSSSCDDGNPCTADVALGDDGLICQNVRIINGAPCENQCLKNVTMDLHKICVYGECVGVCGGTCNTDGAECPDVVFHPAVTLLGATAAGPICYLGQCVYSLFNVTHLFGASTNVGPELAQYYSEACLGLLHSATISPLNSCVTKATWNPFALGGDVCLYSFGCSDVTLPYFYLNPNATFVPSADTVIERAWAETP